jgi:hypothetical protein
MPNIQILRSHYRSQFLDAIVESNARKAEMTAALEVNS